MKKTDFTAMAILRGAREGNRIQSDVPGEALPPGEPRTDRLVRYGSPVFAALLVAVAMYCRVRLLAAPLERDEGGFAYIGQQLLHGIPPYESGNMKVLAGIHFAYALIMALFGESAQGIHAGLLLVNAASMALLFLLARRLLTVAGASVAVGIFACLSVSRSVFGIFAHATNFVILFVLAGLVALLAGLEKERRLLIFVSGLGLGLSVLMKQHALFFCLFALGYLAWESRKSNPGMRVVIERVLLLALGIVVPYAAICIYMFVKGVFAEFWFWTVVRSLDYATESTVSQGLQGLIHYFRKMPASTFLLWCSGGIGLLAALIPRCHVRKRWFPVFLLLVSLLATVPGLTFYPHYFVLVLPALSLLAGVAFDAVPRMLAPIANTARVRPALLVLFLLLGILDVYQQRDYLFRLGPNAVSRMIYGLNPFPESLEVARYIRENSAPGAQIAILGSEPQICFYADRPSATDYLYIYPLVSRQPYVERMQDEMIGEIEKARPEYIVYVGIPTSWLFNDAVGYRIMDWAENYLKAHYRQVGLVDLLSMDSTCYYWGKDAEEIKPLSDHHVQVFRRTL